jgi:hypothetical protein
LEVARLPKKCLSPIASSGTNKKFVNIITQELENQENLSYKSPSSQRKNSLLSELLKSSERRKNSEPRESHLSILLRPMKQSVSAPREEPQQLRRFDMHGTEIVKGGKSHKIAFRDELRAVTEAVPTINVNLSGSQILPAVPGPRSPELELCDVFEVESYKRFHKLNTQTEKERIAARKELDSEGSFCALF